jgi:hypothetical protein
VYPAGDSHAVKLPVSRLQAKLEPGSLLVKAKLADAPLLEAGGVAVNVVSGAIVSTVQVCAVAGPVTVAVARTEKVCEPSPRPL